MADDTPRRARLPREQRREQLLDTAADLVLLHGVEAVTMEGVAAAAGVSKGLGYAYFANRGELLGSLLGREWRELTEAAAAGIAQAPDYEAKVRASVRAWMDGVTTKGTLLAALLRATQERGAYNDRRNRYYRAVEEYWGDLAQREFGVDRRHAVAAAAVMVAGMSGLIERWLLAGDDREMLEDVYVTMTRGAIDALRNLPG